MEEYCASLCPGSEILSRRGSGEALWLEEILRDLFWSHIYIARNKYLYRLNVYFRKIWRMLVEATSEQNPPIPPLFLSPAPSLIAPSFFKCFKCMQWAPALWEPAKTPNEQTTESRKYWGRGGRHPWDTGSPQQGTSVCADIFLQSLFPTKISVFHTLQHSNVSSEKHNQQIRSAIFNWCATRIFKTCNTRLFSQGHWPLFP